MAAPELSVVCKSCGSEVSPYVTECPYCGTRLRRRAPKLERSGDEIKVREGRRERRARRAAERRERRETLAETVAARPYATIAAILAPAVLLVVQRAAGLDPLDVGAIVAPIESDWWRYLAAPFAYDDVGYLFACGLAVALLLPAVEGRVGPVPALFLAIAAGSLGALAAVGIDEAFGDGIVVTAGGNGVALGALGAWFALRRSDGHDPDDPPYDLIAVIIAAAVLLALPLVEDTAEFWAGVAGGAVGLAAGRAAVLGRR